jgi:hypothetical protein
MKRTRFYTVLLLAVLLTAAAIFRHRSHSVVKTISTNTASVISTSTNSETSMPSDNPTENKPTEVAKLPVDRLAQMGITPEMTQGQREEKFKEWYISQAAKMSAQHQHSIEFYGETLDESNQPVAGVNAHLILTESPATPNGIVEANIQSDTQGYFTFTGAVGKLLQVWLDKSGYYVSKSNRIDFDYMGYQPNPNQPEVFHLRKKGSGSDLISAVLNAKMPRDGTPVNIDLIKGKVGASGQLQMSQVKPPYESWKKATAWSFNMTIPDGGFVEESEEFPFEAPINGYLSTITFNFRAGQPDWKTNLKKSYYIVFGTPPCYGRVDIENDIMWDGAHISYSINPDGSRNLEPKP